MDEHQLINQDSGNTEWYTPSEIIEAARNTLGIISLDPFSCAKANLVVKASSYMDKQDDGFTRDWYGSVWCNHPFSRNNNKRIANKIITEYTSGRVRSACMISFAATSEKWFQPLLAYPQCFLHGRTNYYDENGIKVKGVTKGSVVTYFGDDLDKFYDSFNHLGTIKIGVSKGDN